ncbi:MAG: hypothetical protein IJP86_05320 [Synergistaceae bacterium]|nr:hypothetical protein [Synergistaceae bacterium]
MPFLRAAQLAQKKPEVERKSPKMAIRSLEDLKVALAVKAWIALDDLTTKAELARLGY